MRIRFKVVAAVAAFGAALCVFGGLDGSYVVPLDHPAIEYVKRPVDDPVARLSERLSAGELRLKYDPDLGYLPAVLDALHVPHSSQVLVFSRTSFQAPRISPRMPRAIYFNDEVTVGYVRGGDVVELTAADPRQGIIFYTLDQERVARPSFSRQDQCLQCHASGATLGVPGLVVRSVFPDRNGMPVFQAGSFITDHRSPLKQRWGGWYVSGTHGTEPHMGNTVVENRFDSSKGANVTELGAYFDTGAYLTPHSDIVALMVLEHQTRMQNLITRVGFETRMALHEQAAINRALNEPEGYLSESTQRRITNATEELVRYMLFADEAPLGAELRGTSTFAEDYTNAGTRDRKGRSLRDLQLKGRLYTYPCSPLIYSPAFDHLPEMAKERVYRRLWAVLSNADQSAAFAHLTTGDRAAIREILLETKPELPAYWKR